MITVLINDSAILPIENAELKKHPLKVFDIYYRAFNLALQTDFITWFTGFLVTPEMQNLSAKEAKARIKKIMSDTTLMRRITFRLFPFQFEMNPSNWKSIEYRIQTVYTSKHEKPINLFPFAQMMEFYKENEGEIIHV